MSTVTWSSTDPATHVLDCGLCAVFVRARPDGKFVVEASHGQPGGVYDTLEDARKYAGQFVTGLAEDALGKISQLETGRVATGPGVVPSIWHGAGGGVAAICGMVYLRVVEDASWYEDVQTLMSQEDAVAMSQATGVPAEHLVGKPRMVPQLRPGALEIAKAKAIADARRQLRGIVASMEG